MKRILLYLCLFVWLGSVMGQNTVGLLSHDDQKAYEGYNLFFPHNQPNTYLLNNCGQIVHVWEDSAEFRPGNFAYLMEDGRIIKGKRTASSTNSPIWAGGGGETIEIRDWDNNLLYSYTLNDSSARLHHDFAPMPNGNILAIVWEYISFSDAIQAGRDSATMVENGLWPDKIIEIDPVKDSIVWEWRSWDHLIQDHDPTKDNYGDVGAHPELIDLNLDTNSGRADWHHSNSLDYNPVLDQIVISVPQFDEAWIIDHSTTTAEAAGHTGGNSGMGGDLIYRWGNPSAYRTGDGTLRKLDYQHDVHWIDEFVDPSHPDFGKLAVFNNQIFPTFSTVNIFAPVFDTTAQRYVFDDSLYLPLDMDLTKFHPTAEKTWSTGLSSVQLLPNDNLLITVGRFGYTFELTPDDQVVWEYVTPINRGTFLSQGDTSLNQNANLTFRMKRYPVDYPAFTGKDLSDKGWLEINPNAGFCGLLVLDNEPELVDVPSVYPNPAQDVLFIEWTKNTEASLLDLQGRTVKSFETLNGKASVSIGDLPAGIYILRLGMRLHKRL